MNSLLRRSWLVALLAQALWLAACGGSSTPKPATAPEPARPSQPARPAQPAAPSQATVAAVTGCSTFCDQAGPSAAGGPGDPNAFKCPQPYPCVLFRQLSHRATATPQGTVAIRVQCLWSHPCVGALVIWSDSNLRASGRSGGGDISVPARSTATVTLPLTPRALSLLRTTHSLELELGTYTYIHGFGGRRLLVDGDVLTVTSG